MIEDFDFDFIHSFASINYLLSFTWSLFYLANANLNFVYISYYPSLV